MSLYHDCITLTISHHSSSQLSGETISSAQLRSFNFQAKARPTQLSTAYTATLCGSHPAGYGYATPSFPLIAGAAAELSRDRNCMNKHQWDSVIPYSFIIFYLTTFLLTFSTILLLKRKGTIQIFYVFVTGLSCVCRVPNRCMRESSGLHLRQVPFILVLAAEPRPRLNFMK